MGFTGFHDSSPSASSPQTSCLSSASRNNHPGDSYAPAGGDPGVDELLEGALGQRVDVPGSLAGAALGACQALPTEPPASSPLDVEVPAAQQLLRDRSHHSRDSAGSLNEESERNSAAASSRS